jgi:hypothetical protein
MRPKIIFGCFVTAMAFALNLSAQDQSDVTMWYRPAAK